MTGSPGDAYANSRSLAEDWLQQAGRASVVLENEHLRAVFVPALGGKIVSLTSKRSGTEWLLPPLQPYAFASQTGGFEHSDGGGFDECLPTIAANGDSFHSHLQDHGDLWRMGWQGGMVNGALELAAETTTRPLRLARRSIVAGACLTLDYELENIGSEPTDLLYSAHPLLRVQPGDRIVLPQEVRSLRVEGSNGDRRGNADDTIAWPLPSPAIAGDGSDLSQVRPPDGLTADKLFAGPLRDGSCGIFRASTGEGLALRFNPSLLPYLGLWICYGAWPALGASKQYTVALEPTTSDRDSLDEALAHGTALVLGPGERRQWQLTLELVNTEGACRQKAH